MSDKKTKNYTEMEVLGQLKRKADLQIRGKQIQENINPSKGAKGDVGIKSRGKIDFLVNYLGYVHIFVDEFK